MKKVLTLALFLFAGLQIIAQTEGITYQAVIIGPDGQEIPGVDAQGNILPNAEIALRFTILDANNLERYQEVQTTYTDQYGRINLLIGKVDPDGFEQIDWDGTPVDLKVEIDFSGAGTSFIDMSRQELNFVPYSYHRNIIAHGTLVVDDIADLNGELTVAGPTNLNSTLTVHNNNATDLTGSLTVGGATNIGSDLSVDGVTNLNDAISINNGAAAIFTGDVTVAAAGTATFNGPTSFAGASSFNDVTVTGPSRLNGQVTVDVNMDIQGGDAVYNAYPLLVQGSKQGIAIKTTGDRTTNNNYISFWDDTQMWGRIEGQTYGELNLDPEYIIEHGVNITNIVVAGVDIAGAIAELVIANAEAATTAADFRPCVGFGVCVTSPPPAVFVVKLAKVIKVIADVVALAANLATAIVEEGAFVGFHAAQIGVTYQSGSGDYAEWLLKENPGEDFIAGELVGVNNGFVSKNTFGAEKVMVVSTNPIVLGKMPQEKDEYKYVKIAFMGQVPVRVLGAVEPGDYILPSELGSGFGKAVHPDEMTTRDYNKIVGVVWENMATVTDGLNIVNVAVGINNNDLANVVAEQEEKLSALLGALNQLKIQIAQSNTALANLVPGYAEYIENNTIYDYVDSIENQDYQANNQLKSDIPCPTCPDEYELVTIEFSREQMEAGIEIARENYAKSFEEGNKLNSILGLDEFKSSATKNNQVSQSIDFGDILLTPMNEHPFWKRFNSDPDYKEEIIQYIKSSMEKTMQSQEKYNQESYRIKFTGF